MKLAICLLLAVCSLVAAFRSNTQVHARSTANLKSRAHARSHARRVRRVHDSNGSMALVSEPDDGDGADDDDDESEDPDTNDDDVPPELVEARDAMLDVQWKQKTNKATLSNFKDDKAFNAEVDSEAKVVSNETQSPGLAHFLASIRDEMRTYAAPTYTAHLEQQEEKLAIEEKALAAKITALENKSSPSPVVKPAAVAKASTAQDDSKIAAKIAADEVEIKELKEKQEAAGTEAGHVFAFAFLGTVTMLSVVFAMANSKGDGTVRNYTWFLMDQVTAIFLAVMYFQAFDDVLDFMDLGDGHLVLAAVLHAIIMLTIALILAYMLRGREVALATLCGCAAHIVSFTSIHAAAVVQNNVWLSINFHWAFCLIGLVALGLALAGIAGAVFKSKQMLGVSDNDGFMDKTDDVENDFGAMAFSVCWAMFIRFLLTGHHPEDDETEFDHTANQRYLMLANGCVSLVIAGVLVRYCADIAARTKSYFVKRVATFITTVAAMNVAWAFFYFAEWQLFETVFAGQPIFGRIAFALLATVAGALGIFALSVMPSGASKGLNREKKVSLTALSLMVAWSWELCFDAAVDDMCEGRNHPAMHKMCATVFMFLVVVPVYAIYMKPISMPAAEAIGA